MATPNVCSEIVDCTGQIGWFVYATILGYVATEASKNRAKGSFISRRTSQGLVVLN